ncbi:MAG: tyrosine-type recombinase/integrase [Bacteroidaceae bacterium]|nr:tyrosine-type recombinase/integrase [Bacteroidaceae bacterium]
MDAWLEDFFAYLRYERAYSERTIISYSSSLKEFGLYCKSLETDLSWATVTSDVVRSWVVSLIEAGLSVATVCRCLSAVKSFYRFLLKRGLLDVDPSYSVSAPKKRKPLPYFVGEKDMDSLLTEVSFPNTYEGVLSRTVVSMLYATGMRASELLGLNVYDVDFDNSLITVLGKRNKQRKIPMLPELKVCIEDYLRARTQIKKDGGDEEALFLNGRSGKRISYVKLRLLVRETLGKVTMQSKRSPHVLRHSFATSLLNNSADLQSVKELLGHESLKTTAIYTHTTFEELKKLYNQAHPRA